MFTFATPGQVLIVIPPFTPTASPSLAAHILQAVAAEKGFQVDVLYVNMDFANLIGVEQYEIFRFLGTPTVLGERLFAQSAFNLLSPDSFSEPGDSLEELDTIQLKPTDPIYELFNEIKEPSMRWVRSLNWPEPHIGDPRNYTITVTRASSPYLSGLVLRMGMSTIIPLDPSFNRTTLAYTANLAAGSLSVRVTPTAEDAAASITVNGTSVINGQSVTVNLTETSTLITINVTPVTGTDPKAYTVIVTKS